MMKCARPVALFWALLALGAHAETPPSTEAGAAPQPKANTPPLDAITVEAQRNRRELERKVDIFVSSVTVHHEDWAFARWKQPVCPLAAGFPREQGEFILARISRTAQTVGAPLAPEKCQANFLVIVTRQPEQLLKKWRDRNPRMFDTTYGSAQINRFIDTPRPVRVWYNAEFIGADGTSFIEESGYGIPGAVSRVNRRYDGGSRLIRTAIRDVETALVIVDANKLKDVNFGQLADYVSMVGLAETDLDKDLGDAPTILRLFAASRQAPAGLTVWDQAFLKSLYDTQQAAVVQVSEMQSKAIRYIEQSRSN